MIIESRIWLKTRDPMGERNPLVKSHIHGDEIHRKILKFWGWTAGACGVLELGFLSFFSFFPSRFLTFVFMIWLRYVLIMVLGLNWLKYDYLGSKRRNLRFEQSGKRPKDPWISSCWTKRRPDGPLSDRRLVVGSVDWACSTGLY